MSEHEKHEHKEHKHHSSHEKHHAHKKNKKSDDEEISISKTAIWQVLTLLFVVLFVVSLFTTVFDGLVGKSGSVALNDGEGVKTKSLEYINTNLLQGGTQATISDVVVENDMYKLTVSVEGQSITSYVSPDGKMFFPSALALEEELAPAEPSQPQAAAPTPDVPKSETPAVEVFVMSHCPFGTQMEKGILPVVDLLGDKADIQIKFVDYAMHGEVEVVEQHLQYCIQQEYPDEYFKYLQCFLDEGDTDGCLAELGFDQAKLDSCMTTTDTEFDVTKNLEDTASWRSGRFPEFAIHGEDNTKYGVRGSPTLVVNGQTVSTSRDSNSLKNVICNAFEDTPEECNTDLPTATPSSGFGFGTSATDSAAAGCGV